MQSMMLANALKLTTGHARYVTPSDGYGITLLRSESNPTSYVVILRKHY